MPDSNLRSRHGGRLALVIALAAAAIATALAWHRDRPAAERVRLTAGYEGTTRALVAHALAAEVGAHGTHCEVVGMGDSEEEIEAIRNGTVDFALVSSVYLEAGHERHTRVVAPLQLEALHLLVKREFEESVGEGLAGLIGRSVDLGPARSAQSGLARAVLGFAGLTTDAADREGVRALHFDLDELTARIDAGDRDALPDAVFHLATMPSLMAYRLVREAGYVVVPLPFAEALRLQSILEDDDPTDADDAIDRRLIADTAIPPFLYQTKPAVPEAALPTLGARLVLIAAPHVSAATVERVLDAAFDTHFARFLHPAIDRSLLATTPRRTLHPGAVEYLVRNEPAITGEMVSDLNNTLGIAGALIGAGAFSVQGWRQRRRAQREQLVARHLLRIAAIERRIVEIELAAELDLDTLIGIQRELLLLKGNVLELFTSGTLDDHAALGGMLAPVDAARRRTGELLLHVREQIEARAQTEGRAAGEVWAEEATSASSAPDDAEAGAAPQPGGAVTT
jgi:TRAP-type uncharacterized transport system substrate-binding protein